MSLNNDYFLLYHGLKNETKAAHSLKDVDDDLFFEISSLVLSTTRINFLNFSSLDSFKELIHKISDFIPSSLSELYLLQYSIILHIQEHNSSEHIKMLHLCFNYLYDEKLLNQENHKKLLSLFDPRDFHLYEEKVGPIESDKKDFTQNKKELELFIKEIFELSDNISFREDLKSVQSYLDSQKFSIGITGVINAGKSTLLNALMGKEILGSSVVPETANLSLLKYSKESYARVMYWSKPEWEKILRSADEIEAMELFVKQTKEAFKDELLDYIKDEGRIDEIMVKDLCLYTSATKSEKKCNLIKQVELGVDLEFLADGIEIVDTPGLDDIVIQREEITKEYLSRCDLMIHLMNVSQSATQKDIEFIIDALRYQNISKLLIVLTRADSVKESQLQEVIDYTKKSIRSQLKSMNSEDKIESILSSLHFIAVSSKMALYHKTGQAQLALDEGYTLDRTGILELEEYLFKTLYGDESEKSDLIISSVKSRLLQSIEREIKSLRFELHLLSQSKDELETQSKKMLVKKQKNEKLISSLKEELLEYKDEIHDYSSGLETFLDTQMLRTKQKLQSRLIDDLIYALEKKNKQEFISTISRVLDGSIKDGLIDIIRDYRYKFIQKSEEVGHKIEKKYEEYTLDIEQRSQTFSALDLVNEHFKGGILHSNSDLVSSRVKKILDKATLKNISSLEVELDKELTEAFSLLQESLKQKASKISEGLIKEFFENIHQPLRTLEQSLANEEALVQKSLKEYETDDKKRAELSIKIHHQLKSLQSSSVRYSI